MWDELSAKQQHMVKHAWGWDSREPGYRTHYCTQIDDVNMVALVKSNWFYGPRHMGQVGPNCGMFYLTEEALDKLRAEKASIRVPHNGLRS